MSGGGYGGYGQPQGGFGQQQSGFGSYSAGGSPYGASGNPAYSKPDYGSRFGAPTWPLRNPPQYPQMQYQLGQGSPRYAPDPNNPNAINLTGFGGGMRYDGGQSAQMPFQGGGLQYQPQGAGLAQMANNNMMLFNGYGNQAPQSANYTPKGGLVQGGNMETASQITPQTTPVNPAVPQINGGQPPVNAWEQRSLNDPQWAWQQMLDQYAKEDAARAPEGKYDAGAARLGLRAQFGR